MKNPIKNATLIAAFLGVFLLIQTAHAQSTGPISFTPDGGSVAITSASGVASVICLLPPNPWANGTFADLIEGTAPATIWLGATNFNTDNTSPTSAGTYHIFTVTLAQFTADGGVCVPAHAEAQATITFPFVISTPSSFIEPYVPNNGVYSTTTTTVFETSYYFDCDTDFGLLDSLGIDLTDTNTGITKSLTGGTINICGSSSFAIYENIDTSHTYLWRPVMFSSASSSTPIYGNFYSLLSSSTPITLNPAAVSSTLGTSSLPSATNFLSFLNVPVLLETKIPFAYFFQVAQGIQSGINSSSTSAIPPGTFVWTGIGRATTTLDMFSTSTIGYYLSPTLIGLWRAFLLVVLYVEFGYALYTRAKSLHII